MLINRKLVTTYLQQAENPDAFKEKLINSMLSASPLERNYGIVLEHSFSDTGECYSAFAEEQRDAVDMLTKNIYPAAYAIYGREKSFISAYRKLSTYAEVTAMKDQYAQRLILSDEQLDTENAVYFMLLILKNIIDYFQTHMRLLIHPVTERTDCRVPIQKDVRPSLYIPKELPIPMAEYEDFYKNYVMRPKKNGYQGLHFVVSSVDGTSCEWQIWTTSMAKRNDSGSASHDTHKPLDELDQACYERGPEFVKALLTPRIIGEVLMRDTAQEKFPRNLISQ